MRTGVLGGVGDVHAGGAVVAGVTLGRGVDVAVPTAVGALDTGLTVRLTHSSGRVQVGPGGTIGPGRASQGTVGSRGTKVT